MMIWDPHPLQLDPPWAVGVTVTFVHLQDKIWPTKNMLWSTPILWEIPANPQNPLLLRQSHCALNVLQKLEGGSHTTVVRWALKKKHFYKAQRVSNLSSIVRKTSVKSRSKVATSTLKTIAESQGVSTRGGVVQLQSGKKELPVQIGAPQTMPRQATFSHENLMRLQTANNLSDRNLKYVVCKIYCQKMQENFEFILKYIIPWFL